MTSLFATSKLSKESAGVMRKVDEEDADDSKVSSTNNTGNQGETSSSSFQLAQAETRMLQYSKMLVLAVIVILAATMGGVTYKILRDQERSVFENKFHAVAGEIAEFAKQSIHNTFESLERISTEITTDSVDAGDVWPFVNVHSFQIKGMLSNKDTGAHTFTFTPLVHPKDIDEWGSFTTAHQDWIEEGHQMDLILNDKVYEREHFVYDSPEPEGLPWDHPNAENVTPFVWKFAHHPDHYAPDVDHTRVRVGQADLFAPMWQTAPVPDYTTMTNYDFRSDAQLGRFVDGMMAADEAVITEVVEHTYLMTQYDHRFPAEEIVEPHSYIFAPLYDSLYGDSRNIVAFLASFIPWGAFFHNVLSTDQEGIVIVLSNSCNQSYTYEIFGKSAEFYGVGDLHATKSWSYDGLHLIGGVTEELAEHFHLPSFSHWKEFHVEEGEGHTFQGEAPVTHAYDICEWDLSVYPDFEFRDVFFTDKPIAYAACVVCCFIVTTFVFGMYDLMVQRRQKIVMDQAKKTSAIVNSLFPDNVRERLMDEVDNAGSGDNKPDHKGTFLNAKVKNSFTSNSGARLTSESIFGSKPIADLFPEATIMFADIVGFTAWSSIREPAQVFSLLETLYHAFDNIAKRRRVFKVETIGDCYVAVAGLPVAREDHAVVMAKYANDCLREMKEVLNSLDTLLGPDTSDLTMRFGLHSGQVTAGVLRGEKGRFQLFGDSMNTASRMESTSLPGKIQCSRDTADLLIQAGREKWVMQRKDKVVAKGLGTLQTYWLRIHVESNCTGSHMTNNTSCDSVEKEALERKRALTLGTENTSVDSDSAFGSLSLKMQRMVEWNVDILVRLLQQILARRSSSGSAKHMKRHETRKLSGGGAEGNVLDEVQDILALPQFDAKTFHNAVDPNSIEISDEVINQLKDLVARIAAMYRENPFHNFEHASHVTMSINKLLSRIVSPIEVSTRERADDEIAANLHDHTFGITSDPLTQFACVISGLIHDADHPGVPNMVLVKEEDPLAEKYKGKSVAEQNSVDLAWNILMSSDYKDLRACIYSNKDELERFRSIVVNVVMATDIMDKELGAVRKARWEKAFSTDNAEEDEDPQVTRNRRATIVLEHLMQASDVAHTMQHWTVYKKWNERLFRELYKAFKEGRSETDPSKGWYQGEIGFFDYYLIPLANKLQQCGVFGVSSQEYLNYATSNREEWRQKGESVIQDYLRRLAEED